MAHGHAAHHGGHHNPGHAGQHHHPGHAGQHHHHHHGHPLPRLPVPVPVLVPVPPRTTVQYSYLPTTVGTPLLEPRRPPSGALLGVLACMFCFVLLVVAFVLWL